MSDAPDNPERRWDTGLRDEDIVALIACSEGPESPVPAESAVYFSVRALRASVRHSTLGSRKSASEGAESDRTWPSTVPRRPGLVLSVDEDGLAVSWEGDDQPPSRYTYRLRDKHGRPKHAYVGPGERFEAKVTILAGVPESLADVNRHLADHYDPLCHLSAEDAMDRYAAVKALRFRADLREAAVPALDNLLDTEQEIRVALEAAGTAAALGSNAGEERIAAVLWADGGDSEMSMEAVLILTELKTAFAREQLCNVAMNVELRGNERRCAPRGGGIRGLARSRRHDRA